MKRAAAMLSLALVTSPAHAEGIGVIAVGEAADRTAVATALAEVIGARTRVVGDAVAEARAQLAAGAVPVATLAQFRRVREMVDEGWRAYLRVQIDFAQSRLAAARGEAEALVALPGGIELYADAALRLGAVLQQRRNPDAAAVFALALALDPARPITLAEFSPDVVEAVDAVRGAPVALHRLRVTTSPPGAQVSIDGTVVGQAPIDVQVTRGQHLVTARAARYRALVQGVRVDPTALPAASVDLDLLRDDEAAQLAIGAAPGLAAPAEQRLVDAVLGFADVDDVVVAGVVDRRGGPTLIAQRCGGATALCTGVVEVGFGERAGLPGAVRTAWQAIQTGALREPPSVIGDSKRAPTPSGCRLCRNPYVWTGVGAVVLGAVIAIVATSGATPPPVLDVHGGDFRR